MTVLVFAQDKRWAWPKLGDLVWGFAAPPYPWPLTISQHKNFPAFLKSRYAHLLKIKLSSKNINQANILLYHHSPMVSAHLWSLTACAQIPALRLTEPLGKATSASPVAHQALGCRISHPKSMATLLSSPSGVDFCLLDRDGNGTRVLLSPLYINWGASDRGLMYHPLEHNANDIRHSCSRSHSLLTSIMVQLEKEIKAGTPIYGVYLLKEQDYQVSSISQAWKVPHYFQTSQNIKSFVN